MYGCIICYYVIAVNNIVIRTKQHGCVDCYTVLIQGLAGIITRFLKNESEYLKIINLHVKYIYNLSVYPVITFIKERSNMVVSIEFY